MFFSIKKRRISRTAFEMMVVSKSYAEVMKLLFKDRKSVVEVVFKVPPANSTFLNRVGLILFVPIYFVSIPFQYLFRGKLGVDRHSAFGEVLSKIVGEF